MAELTPKQERFVQEYLIDSNATQAAIRAGYSPKTAAEQSSRLLTKANIAASIQKGRAKIAAMLDFTAADVLRELAKIGFANMEDYTRLTEDGYMVLDASNLTRDQKAAISEISYDASGRPRIKLADKLSALEKLGKHLGMFTDRQVVKLEGGVPHEWTIRIVHPPAKDECAQRPAGAHSPPHMHA